MRRLEFIARMIINDLPLEKLQGQLFFFRKSYTIIRYKEGGYQNMSNVAYNTKCQNA